MHTTSHIKLRGAAIAAAALALAVFLSGASTASAHPGAASTLSPYGWPVKPFDRPHPIRGNFGDPRTVFAGPPTQRTLLAGDGAFQFHDGVDIAAPDGTAVYPVESGTVVMVTHDWVSVAAGDRAFQYWHIAPRVTVGEHVDVDATVLGHILHEAGHVHLTELDGGFPANPLAPGHLSPYSDTSKPVVSSIAFRTSVTGADLMPELLRGRVEILVDTHDMPTRPVSGCWHDLPVTPALIEWRIERADTGQTVVPTHVAFDVRAHLPALSDFWRVYARGTHQNMSVFGKHFSFMQPGVYLFRLAPGGFDTRTLPDSVYDLVVTVTDIRGNHSSAVQRFSVHNKPGVVGA
jgi:hypothetical protein